MPGRTFTIRSFNSRRECAGLDVLEDVLAKNYQGQSVSVQFTRSSGIDAVVFVDVTADAIRESYGERQPVDFLNT